MNIDKLEDAELDESVAHALGWVEAEILGERFWRMGGGRLMLVSRWMPTVNWHQASPIMLENKIAISPLNGGWQARTCVQPYVTASHPFRSLTAAMRCFVKSR